jgi:hypothetical protein
MEMERESTNPITTDNVGHAASSGPRAYGFDIRRTKEIEEQEGEVRVAGDAGEEKETGSGEIDRHIPRLVPSRVMK